MARGYQLDKKKLAKAVEVAKKGVGYATIGASIGVTSRTIKNWMAQGQARLDALSFTPGYDPTDADKPSILSDFYLGITRARGEREERAVNNLFDLNARNIAGSLSWLRAIIQGDWREHQLLDDGIAVGNFKIVVSPNTDAEEKHD